MIHATEHTYQLVEMCNDDCVQHSKSIYAPAFWIWHWWAMQGGICMY